MPAIQTRFLEGRTILIDGVHLMIISDVTKSVVVYAAYVFMLYNLFGNEHLTYWIHPEYDTITLTFDGSVVGILRSVGDELIYPTLPTLKYWKRRSVLVARRIWEVNVQTILSTAAKSPEFLFSKNTVPTALRKKRVANTKRFTIK